MYILSRIRRIHQNHAHEREKTMLKLHAIQAQVNPHFLFNSFNTLAGIIEEDQEAAVDYIDQLSAFFRDVLMHRNAELIQLQEEMEMVRHYAFLLQKRYGLQPAGDGAYPKSGGLDCPIEYSAPC
jgi:LytS/YehU family sensor histidine kinase